MKKILIVAESEFATLVRTKAFIIGIILLPVVMGGSILLSRATRNATDDTERTFAIVDHTGTLGDALVAAAQATGGSTNGTPGPKFVPVQVAVDGRNIDDVRLELSDKVRRRELFAFVEIPAEVLQPESQSQILYYSDHPSYLMLPQWLRIDDRAAGAAATFSARRSRPQTGGTPHRPRPRRSTRPRCARCERSHCGGETSGSCPRPGRSLRLPHSHVSHDHVECATAAQQRHRREDEPRQ